jgi:hypothetical protein
MITRALTLAAVLGSSIFVPALAQDMVGDEAPDAAIKEWVVGNACKSFKDLRGKAILVEFFATW